jgi:hypothetical protein
VKTRDKEGKQPRGERCSSECKKERAHAPSRALELVLVLGDLPRDLVPVLPKTFLILLGMKTYYSDLEEIAYLRFERTLLEELNAKVMKRLVEFHCVAFRCADAFEFDVLVKQIV